VEKVCIYAIRFLYCSIIEREIMIKISKGIYQTNCNGHVIEVRNVSEFISGTLVWEIISGTLDLELNTEKLDTLYSTKKECLEVLPEIVKTSPLI